MVLVVRVVPFPAPAGHQRPLRAAAHRGRHSRPPSIASAHRRCPPPSARPPLDFAMRRTWLVVPPPQNHTQRPTQRGPFPARHRSPCPAHCRAVLHICGQPAVSDGVDTWGHLQSTERAQNHSARRSSRPRWCSSCLSSRSSRRSLSFLALVLVVLVMALIALVVIVVAVVIAMFQVVFVVLVDVVVAVVVVVGVVVLVVLVVVVAMIVVLVHRHLGTSGFSRVDGSGAARGSPHPQSCGMAAAPMFALRGELLHALPRAGRRDWWWVA